MFSLLREYKETYGNCLVPNRHKPFPPLGRWVAIQRRYYKNLKAGQDTPLKEERIKLLESIGFAWVAQNPQHVPWEDRVEELIRYKNEHGDCLVPTNFDMNPKLSNWVSNQRQEWKLFKKEKFSRLTEAKIEILNSIGFVWEAQRKKRSRKDSKSDATEELVVRELCDLPICNRACVTNPRMEIIQNVPKTNERLNATETLPLKYESQFEWNKMFTELRCYKSLHGNTFVQWNHHQNSKLGKWVSAQRYKYWSISMKSSHIHLLDSIGFAWEEPTNQYTYHSTNAEIPLQPADDMPHNDIYSTRKRVKRESVTPSEPTERVNAYMIATIKN